MSGSTSSPILVGREAELEAIANAMEIAASGRPRLILLGGEAGVGKTRLVQEVVARASAAGSPVLFGSCLDIGDGGLPYLPMSEALRGLARTLSADELDRALGQARVDLAALVPELAGTNGSQPATPPERSDLSGADRARLFERWIGFIGRLGADAPLLAIVEDVHWIDRASRDLVTFLVRNVTTERVTAILTYRTDELPPGHPTSAWLAELSRAPGGIRMDLDRLDRSAVRKQLETIAGDRLPSDTLARIWRQSEGNPLFAEELLASSAGHADRARPPSLVEILLARTTSLPADALAVLATVAVAARPVDERLLSAVLERPESEVTAALHESIARAILVPDDASGRFRFRHELLREVVEHGLLAGERRGLHEQFATLLEARPELGDPSPAGAAAELAHHWAAAGRVVEAHRSAIAAAAAAETVQAFAEAHLHYERALELEADLPVAERPADAERIEVRRRAADVADLDGDSERATALCREALDLVDADADPTTAGLLHGRLGFLRWVTGDSASALDEHREAVRLVPAEPPSSARARVLGGLGGALMGAGRWLESKAVCEEAIACAIAAGARVDESRARNMLGSDLVFLGQIEAGLDELRQARTIAAETGPAELLVVGHFNLALNLLAADHVGEALAEAEAGRQAARDTGLERRYGMDTAALLGDILLRVGRWDDAEAVTLEGLALDQLDQGTIYLAAVRSRLLALRGEDAEAERRLARIDRTSLDPDVAAFVAAVRAEAALAAGRPESAVAAADEGLAGMADLEEALWVAPVVGLGLTAAAELAEGRKATRDQAAPGASESAAIDQLRGRLDRLARTATTHSSQAWVAHGRAEIARLDGAPDAALWDAVAAAWDEVADSYLASRARLRAAETRLRAEGLRAADVAAPLRAAHSIARSLRAAPLVSEIEALAKRARIDLAPSAPEASETVETPVVPVGPGRPTGRPHGLSERELEVLALVAAGRTNGEIAERLFITRKTAAVHVTHILDKLGVSNRVEAAMIAARLGLADAADTEADARAEA
ncbi:MAG TPA: AAA family ATPase [Candidatus Limnocylindrales bacterium]